MGKTRLALAGATALAGDYPGGVRWVDLVPVTEPARLADAVAQACDAVVSSRRGPVEALIAALRGRPALLVLDNAEHVLNAVAVLAEQLASSCPRLTILVTSRARLALPHERVVAVPGLSPAGDATALFIERAVAAGSLAPTEAERERISTVCETLGGLPLAVELAAVRMPALGLDGVERGLADQSSLLRGGARLHRRHRSMRETIDWSVDLIGPAAATALCRLGVLVAPFGTEAAIAVAAFPPLSADDVLAALVRLSEHNLLATIQGGQTLHYRMLEPIRQYGLARMTAGDVPAYAQHLAWCLRRAEAAFTGDRAGTGGSAGDGESSGTGGSTGDGARMIADDTRAALAWAAREERPPVEAQPLARRFGLLLYRDGTIREAQERLAQAAALTRDGTEASADLARAAAVAKCRVSGEEALGLELAAARRATDPRDRARALGRAAELLSRFPGMFAGPAAFSADELMRQASQLAPGDPRTAAVVAVAAASYAGASGAPSMASARAALDAARSVPDAVLESGALDALIAAAIFGGDVVTAHRLAQQRLARLAPWRDDPAAGLELKDALHVATFCALGAGDLATARDTAHRQHGLPFLRERRDLSDDELLAPAALAGRWDDVLAAGQRFAEDWTAAGRPAAPGRGLAPASVALAHGLLGDQESRRHWLLILARVRGVSEAGASRGSGYGELFEAMVKLHEDAPQAALGALAAGARRALPARVHTVERGRAGRSGRPGRRAGGRCPARPGTRRQRRQPDSPGHHPEGCRAAGHRPRGRPGHRRRVHRGRIPLPARPVRGPRRAYAGRAAAGQAGQPRVTGTLPVQPDATPSRDVEVVALMEQPGQDDAQGLHRLGPVAAPIVLQDDRSGTGVVHDVADDSPDPWPRPVTRVDRPVHRHHPHLLALPEDGG